MTSDLLMRNSLSLLLQTVALAGIGAALPGVWRLEAPRPLLRYWQILLAILLLLPAAQYLGGFRPAGSASLLGLLQFNVAATKRGLPSGTVAVSSWVLAFLALGMLLRMCSLGLGLLRLSQYRRRSEPAGGCFGDDIRVSSEIQGPASFGVLRPVVLLPQSWRFMPTDMQNLVVRHEMIHLRRQDWIAHLIEDLLRAALWFHPAIWFVTAKIRSVREQVVDLEVVLETRSRDAYIHALLSAANAMGNLPALALPAPCFARKHQLVDRIRKLKKEYSMSTQRAVLSSAGIALVLLAGGRAAIWSFPLQAAQSGSSGKVYKIKEGITPPRLLSKVEPEYTEEARTAKIEGPVVLTLEITPEGRAQNIAVSKSLEPGLDQKAIDAIYQWRFAPGVKDGEIVTVAATIEVNFHLK